MTGDELTYAFGLEPAEAVDYFRRKGTQVTGGWAQWLDGEHARAFTVANVAKLDVLQDIKRSLDDALAKGVTFEQWKRDLVPTLQAKGWWQRDGSTAELQAAGRVSGEGEIAKGLTPARLGTIFQTNMQSAYMAGRHEQMIEQAEERPYWQYTAVMDSRTRPAHAAMNGRTFRYDDPGWGAFFPPCGYRCRCRAVNFSQREIVRRKIEVSSTEGKLHTVQGTTKDGTPYTLTQYRDPTLPGGRFTPDVGFGGNPARTAWQPRLEPYDTALSRRYVETMVQGPAFERFVQRTADGVFPVAVLRDSERRALNTPASVAYLSSETLAKQAEKHPDVGAADYRELPRIVDEGEVYRQNDLRLIFLAEGDVMYRAALKVTRDGRELYVISLFKTTEKAARKEVAGRWERLR